MPRTRCISINTTSCQSG